MCVYSWTNLCKILARLTLFCACLHSFSLVPRRMTVVSKSSSAAEPPAKRSRADDEYWSPTYGSATCTNPLCATRTYNLAPHTDFEWDLSGGPPALVDSERLSDTNTQLYRAAYCEIHEDEWRLLKDDVDKTGVYCRYGCVCIFSSSAFH